MRRLTINLTDPQFKQLQIQAVLEGRDIQDVVLQRVFGTGHEEDRADEEEAWQVSGDFLALQTLLAGRMQAVRDGKTVFRTADDIKVRARQMRDQDV